MQDEPVSAPIIVVDSKHPQPRHIARAVSVLEQGGLVAYPTDTHYGIGCDLMNRKAVERIYQLKQRPKNKPLSFICADLSEVSRYGQLSNIAFPLVKRLTPGPYTFILKATNLVPKIAVTRQRSVGIRIPDSPIALALVRGLGRPLLSSSAITPEGEELIDAADIQRAMGHGLGLILDGGYQYREQSTVLDVREAPPVVLREGKGEIDGLF